VDLFTPDSPAALFAHLALLIPGALWLWRRGHRREAGSEAERGRRLAREFLALTAGFVFLTVAATALFFGYVRQGVLVLPFLCGIEGVTAAAAARWLARRGAGLRGSAAGAGSAAAKASPGHATAEPAPSRALVALVAVLWLVELGGAFQNRNFIATGETIAGSKMLNRDSVMHLAPTREKPPGP
jgi:hypothetical protein